MIVLLVILMVIMALTFSFAMCVMACGMLDFYFDIKVIDYVKGVFTGV